MSQAALGKLVNVSPDLIGKVEKAVRWPTEALARSCDSVLDTGGTLIAMWADVACERDKDRLHECGRTAQEIGALEPIGEVARRVWRLGDAATEAAAEVFNAAITDLVDRYEIQGPATLAPHAVMLRRQLDSLIDGRPTSRQRQRLLASVFR
jgi:hypothetical protein